MTLRFWFRHVVRVIAAFVLWYVSPTPALCQSAPHVVISEIYGGGGNSGALYTHDFIEIYNPTGSDVVMNDWSVQYQGGGGTGVFTSVAGFSGIIRSHGFFLIQANPGSGGTVPLPSPDAVAGISMAAGSGKIALCSDAIGIGSPLDPGVVDFVGYGPANLFEGPGPAAAPGNTTSVERKATAGSDAGSMSAGGAEEHSGNGRDSDDNGADFIRRDPGPQNDASGTEIPGGNLNVMAVYEGKWNLVSLPLAVADPAASTVFPGALTPLYGYRGGYVGETTAVPGAGYWVRFGEPETVTFAGQATDPDTIVLDAGWNLVGSIAAPVAVGGLGQIPDNHIAGALFEYDGGYRKADTIRPGEAYWVRSTTGGSLVLGSGPSAAGSAARSTREPEGTIRILDGSGGLQAFGIRNEPGDPIPRIDAAIPPPPPDGAFDVRVVRDGADERTYLVRIRSAAPAITLAWDLDAIPGWGLEFSPHGRTEGRGEPPRSSGSEMLPPLADQILRIRIARDTPGPVGPKFTDLYPNPFNPATTIGIFMPVAGEVEIDIVDLTGRRVATLARGFRNAGHHSIDWDARGPEGLPVAGGVYLVVLRSGGLTAVRKVLHLK